MNFEMISNFSLALKSDLFFSFILIEQKIEQK